MTTPLAGFLERLADPELAALRPELVERLLVTIFRDVGISLTMRTGAGRGRSLTDPEIDIDAGGKPVEFDDAPFRYFSTDGKEVPFLQHPVHQVRTSGTREQNRVIGVRIENGRQRWFLMSCLPLEREDDGWSTLTIAADVSTLFTRGQHAEAYVAASAALLDLASSLLLRGATDPATIAAAAQPFANSQFPQCMTVLSILEGRELRIWPVQLQPGIDPPPERMPINGRFATSGARGHTSTSQSRTPTSTGASLSAH